MKFSKYIEIKEAVQTQEIDAIFNQASTDIQGLFGQLYKGTANMVRNYEKATLPQELQNQLLQDLSKMAQKIKGKVKTENITINTFIKNINELISEVIKPSIVQDLGSHRTSTTGKPTYDFKSTLTNTYRLVMDRMSQLKDAVLKQLGIIHDTHSKILGLRNTAGNIRNKLNNPSQPFNQDESDKAQDSMIALSNAVGQLGELKLISYDGKEIKINPTSETWKNQVLKYGQKHKIFTLITPNGSKEEINMGNPSQIHSVLDSLGLKTSSDFIPKKQKKARTIKLKDEKGKVINP